METGCALHLGAGTSTNRSTIKADGTEDMECGICDNPRPEAEDCDSTLTVIPENILMCVGLSVAYRYVYSKTSQHQSTPVRTSQKSLYYSLSLTACYFWLALLLVRVAS